jgi:hypothetical protein
MSQPGTRGVYYLGPWKSPESRAEYERLVAEWLAVGRGKPQPADVSGLTDTTVVEVLAAFMCHAETHYPAELERRTFSWPTPYRRMRA